MVFKDEIENLIGKEVKFTRPCEDHRIVWKGIVEAVGRTGDEAAIIITDGPDGYSGTMFIDCDDIYELAAEIPDGDSRKEYEVARYMSRIRNLRDLIRFPIEFDITDDVPGRAYEKRAAELTGFTDL